MYKAFIFAIILFLNGAVYSQKDITYIQELNIPYYAETIELDDYIQERCMLDIRYPKEKSGFATLVWFHGGGLREGNKYFPQALMKFNLCLVAVNYRLYPRVNAPAYIEDAAAAVAWVFDNIEQYGGDTNKIFVSGHSAGGYLTSMIGLDKRWLAKHDKDADNIAGLIPLSGHTITHFTIREERGLAGTRVIVDELAPIYHIRNDAPPLLLITGDRELEILGRYEENAYLKRMMLVVGHQNTRLYELQGYGHAMTNPAFPLLVKEIKKICDLMD